MKHDFKFQKEHSFEKRQQEATRILKKYPDRIPIIVEPNENNNDTLIIDKKKYLVPKDLTVGQFSYVIRKRIKLSPDEAMFIFTDDCDILSTNDLMSRAYKEHQSEDGFLYVIVSKEQTFG